MFKYDLIKNESARFNVLPKDVNPDDYYFHVVYNQYIAKSNELGGSRYIYKQTEYKPILFGIGKKTVSTKEVIIFNPFKSQFGKNKKWSDICKELTFPRAGNKDNPLTNIFLVLKSNMKEQKNLKSIKSNHIISEVCANPEELALKELLKEIKRESSSFSSVHSIIN